MSLSLFSLKGKEDSVTEAGRGIGKAIALRLDDVGVNVVVTARATCDIEATAGKIVAKGRRTCIN